ncbi:LOW QUALITY PROTEIN: keratin-associated protein 13-1-like [Eptesicus fuscus]|uniref:LOW QUALITY PROTEIN: keratin-associated protein 13-1-like n=1 Tax=Eptesicus fuscus TaxID=29078 RepID=UPI002403A30D|nr:LOW QUALITY PROTEIN: keratin-associated protein 13-1-like [Eptesicus fuscus]
MSHSGCPGNLSSGSLGGPLRPPRSSCGSHPSNLVYSPAPCAPGPCPRGPSLHRSRQETCREPPRCRTPPICGPGTSSLCGPCGTTRPGSLGCGSPGVRPGGHGVCGFPSQSSGPGFCRPTCPPSRVTQASCYRPAWGSRRR